MRGGRRRGGVGLGGELGLALDPENGEKERNGEQVSEREEQVASVAATYPPGATATSKASGGMAPVSLLAPDWKGDALQKPPSLFKSKCKKVHQHLMDLKLGF